MSCTDFCSKSSGTPIYVSTVEVMVSSTGAAPSSASKSAAWGSSFQRMPSADILSDSAWYFPACLPSTETLPRNGILPSHCLSSEVYSSRLDIVLAHSNSFGKDSRRVNPSSIKPACPTLHRSPQCNGYSSAGAQSPLASSKRYPGSDQRACHSSTDHAGPVQFAGPFSSATASRALPCQTSHLNVSLCAIPDASPSERKNLSTALAPCSSEPMQPSYSHCNARLSDLHASVKLYISTCSIAIKPCSHACSSILLPHLKTVSSPSSGCETGPQVTHQAIPSRSSADLRITQFHVTSTAKCPGLPQQTVSREIWLSPATVSTVDASVGKRIVTNPHLDPDLVVFQNCHSTGRESGRTSSTEIVPTHHKISKITLILATPWASFPIKVIREFRRSPAPSVFINTPDSDMDGPSFQPDYIGSGFSLSIKPVCCPELCPSQQLGANSGPNLFQEPDTVGNANQDTLATSVQTCTTRTASHQTGESVWCPSISVKIASYGAGRKVVKISIPF